jgi:adenylate cyclase
MNFEIERKFLVCSDEWQPLSTGQTHIRQAYLACDARVSIRVRIRREKDAALTIKSREPQIRRLELECPIPILDAEVLIQLSQGAPIEKLRHTVPLGAHTWEIDVFLGQNSGLVIAEIELKHEGEGIERPSWIGAEVTGQWRYYNSSLAQRPFCSWVHTEFEGVSQSP